MLTDPINTVPEQFLAFRGLWFHALFHYANDLFFMLALIEIGLGVLLWMVYRQDLEALGLGLLKKILWIGFMYAVLFHADTWIPSVIDSFVAAGQDASGFPSINPGEVFVQGLSIAGKMLKEMISFSLLFKPASTLVGIFAALAIVLAFAIIAIELAVTLIESYLVTGAGVFLLGFAAFRGTAGMAERYFSFVLAVGVKLLVLYLIIGAGAHLPPQWAEMINASTLENMNVPLVIMGASIMFGVVAWHIPAMAGALTAGTVALGFQDVLGATVQATRIGAATIAAPIEVGRGAMAVGSVARAVSQQHGGGVRGALRGIGAAGGVVAHEVAAASVPRLHHGVQSIRDQAQTVRSTP